MRITRWIFVISLLAAVIVLFQCSSLNYYKRPFLFLSSDEGSVVVWISNVTSGFNGSKLDKFGLAAAENGFDSDLSEIEEKESVLGYESEEKESVTVSNVTSGFNSSKLDKFGLAAAENGFKSDLSGENGKTEEKQTVLGYEFEEKVDRLVNDSSFEAREDRESSGVVNFKKGIALLSINESLDIAKSTKTGYDSTNNAKGDQTNTTVYVDSRISDPSAEPLQEKQPKNPGVQRASSIISNNNISAVKSISVLLRGKVRATSISQMNSIFLQSRLSSFSGKPQRSSARDRELISARRKIENAPIVTNTPGLYAPVFRNVSMFSRSYELMERTLKVYVYKEGEKPIFHQPYMRGIYSSEGWFMKLMEGNKQFSVRDPKKAHLFYLPFSANLLRSTFFERKIRNHNTLEKVLKDYVELIAGKYHYWNRTGGADHFLVACHDWAPRITRNYMGNCIKSLCNSNLASGFNIGKDTTLPVTYIKSVQRPLGDLGGKPPSERPILAFFAGSMHGYLRPILLQYWENKEPDMKILGPMPRDLESKKVYREYMKSSKYCVCARGYEVHTPRVVEAILYECVPVILSDNYVPPFFEVLNWETFSVFVLEKDIPNLRNILLSIPEEKYLEMQLRVKMVQQHFLWHKPPLKYDLFHMTLHSVWYNRVFQVKVKPR